MRKVVLWRDECQSTLTEEDVQVAEVARESGLVQVNISQNLPALYAAMGGGPKMLLAFFIPLMACAFVPPASPQEWHFVLYMTALYPFAAGIHRARGKLLRWRGYLPHSMYSGDSALPGSQTWAKSTAEPLFTILLGAVACLVSPPLGAYLIAAGICLGITSMHVGRRDRAIVDAMRDAEIEQTHYADLYERSKSQ